MAATAAAPSAVYFLALVDFERLQLVAGLVGVLGFRLGLDRSLGWREFDRVERGLDEHVYVAEGSVFFGLELKEIS